MTTIIETIGKEWTCEERLKVIRTIAQELAERALKLNTPPEDVYHTATSIVLVAEMGAGFLEMNRAQIMKEAGVE